MPKWTSYSYINLAARGVDCLSYLAVARVKLDWFVELRKYTSSGQVTWGKGANLSYRVWLAPIAEIRPNVFISGVRLLSGGVGPSGVTSNAILTPIDISTVSPNVEYNGLYTVFGLTTNYAGGLQTVPLYSGNSYGMVPTLYSYNTIRRAYQPVGEGIGNVSLFDWDDVHNIASVTISINAEEIMSVLGNRFSTDFSGQPLSLDASYTYTRTFSMQCPYPESASYIRYNHSAVDDYGPPWSEPLFKFPFVRS